MKPLLAWVLHVVTKAIPSHIYEVWARALRIWSTTNPSELTVVDLRPTHGSVGCFLSETPCWSPSAWRRDADLCRHEQEAVYLAVWWGSVSVMSHSKKAVCRSVLDLVTQTGVSPLSVRAFHCFRQEWVLPVCSRASISISVECLSSIIEGTRWLLVVKALTRSEGPTHSSLIKPTNEQTPQAVSLIYEIFWNRPPGG